LTPDFSVKPVAVYVEKVYEPKNFALLKG